MEYKILFAVGVTKLENLVKDHIKDGWTPLGGVSITGIPKVIDGLDATVFSCSQAMTR